MVRLERIVFFGTPAFAVPSLEALARDWHRPVLVVTQPPRPAGRGRRLLEPPVAEAARSLGIPVAQPRRINDAEFLGLIAELTPDLAVVVAYGRVFPPALLTLPAYGSVNVHASLLPAYRGAAPIQAAIAAGDRCTGVTTMLMDEGLDTGPMILRESLAIGPRETALELTPRLADLGGIVLSRTLRGLQEGSAVPVPQPESGVSLAPRLTKEAGQLSWTLTAVENFNRLRAFIPWPGSTSLLRDAPLKVLWAEPLDGAPGSIDIASAEPGTCLGLFEEFLVVRCGGGTILGVRRVQRPGKKALSARDFVNGEHLQPGETFV